jgi:hypothetical protein
VQNTRGTGIYGYSVASTGVTNSYFSNIGMYWQTSLLATDRHQAIAFCCNGTVASQKNYAINNYFTNIGLDSLSFTGQADLVLVGNRCYLKLATPQYVTLSGTGNWPACVYFDNNVGGTLIGNVSDSAPGNGFDIGPGVGHSNFIAEGNYALNSGGAGISIATTVNFSVSNNQIENNVQNASDCHQGGLTFVGVNTNGSVVGNTMNDTQSTKTQKYGVYALNACSFTTTLTNVWVDQNNSTVGNLTAAFGGGITGPNIANLGLSGTYTGNWIVTPASGVPITINAASGQAGLTVTGNGAATGINVIPSSGNAGLTVVPTANGNSIKIASPSAVNAQILLAGNANSGSTGFLINQDASNNANLSNQAAGAMIFNTNGATRYTIASDGGLFSSGVTGGDKGAGSINVGSCFVSNVACNTGAPVLTGTTGSIGGGALLAGACTTGTASVASSTTSMSVAAAPVSDPGTSVTWEGFVSSAGTVTVRVCALIAATPTATTYNVRVLQ